MPETSDRLPNIVYFLVDDMGYGDVACLNPAGRIATPHIDRLAREGMSFTDAHSTSAVCSPSRYSILTGRYNWRSKLQAGIVPGYGPPMIDAGRLTVPGLLRQHGYHCMALGKWHLGWDWPFEPDREIFQPRGNDQPAQATAEQKERWAEAFSRPIAGGPTTRGFDAHFGVDVPNWPPYCFIENDRTVGVPSELLPQHMVAGNRLASISGPAMPGWRFEQLLPTWAEKADQYFAQRADDGKPFFLYMAMTSPHTPLSVNKPWIGKSGLDNPYADLVMETDDVLGRVLDALQRHGLDDNTLVIFTSDNGCAPYVGVDQLEAQGHRPSAHFRGYKSDAWDGGHRIPLIARWPRVIRPGSQCDQLVCLCDLMATCAAIVGQTLPPDAGEDSADMHPLFQETGQPIRQHVVHHSIAGKFALRDEQFKLVLCPGSGGWTLKDSAAVAQGLPLVQLYNMQADPGETSNLHTAHPDKVRSMVAMLKTMVETGRTTPGPCQTNDVPVDIWKLNTLPGVSPAALDDY